MLLEWRLRRRLSRIIARLVSRNMPACRLDGVVHLILYLFAAKVPSTFDLLDLTVCDLCYGCSGVGKLLIWSVSLGNRISEVSMLNLQMLRMDCFRWRSVAVVQSEHNEANCS